MNIARENILDRVRAALRTEAPRPAAATTPGQIWPPVTDVERRLREEFEAVKGELIETPGALGEFLGKFTRIATDGSPFVREIAGEGNAGVRDCELAVTGCDCLVAQTGSIFVSTRSAGGRTLSALPAVHLVIARREQLVPDLAAAFAWLRRHYGGNWPSAVTLITGPSRTADIEKTIVLGAHGPKRLALYFAG
jgi:L-lactate dehydrogenase complex protein LldG